MGASLPRQSAWDLGLINELIKAWGKAEAPYILGASNKKITISCQKDVKKTEISFFLITDESKHRNKSNVAKCCFTHFKIPFWRKNFL